MKEKIIKNLITNGAYNLIENNGQICMNNINMNHNFNMFLNEYELKESNQNSLINNVNKDNHQNIIINMNNFKSENYEIQKRNLESEKELFNGNKINSEEISSDKVNYPIKKKKFKFN